MSMKNSSDTIGNRTRDLPTCSAVPQPTAPTGRIVTSLPCTWNASCSNARQNTGCIDRYFVRYRGISLIQVTNACQIPSSSLFDFIKSLETMAAHLLLTLLNESEIQISPALSVNQYHLKLQSSESLVNLLTPSGFFTYHQGLTLKNSTWRSLCVECFVRISEQTATSALYIIN